MPIQGSPYVPDLIDQIYAACHTHGLDKSRLRITWYPDHFKSRWLKLGYEFDTQGFVVWHCFVAEEEMLAVDREAMWMFHIDRMIREIRDEARAEGMEC